MTAQALAKWIAEHSNVPQKALKPLATRLGVPSNYVGAALFAGQVVYENQEAIVTYAGKGGVTVGEFLHARSRERYGPDHPLTEHFRENTAAISEAFEGTEAEARTVAEFYRQYRKVDREHRFTDAVNSGQRFADASDRGVLGAVSDAMPGRDAISNLRGGADIDADPDEAVEIPVTDAR
jgi:hypothetical protein